MTTIGVAVAVPEPWGTRLQDYRIGLGDDLAAGIPTHITLLPPIDVEDHLVPRIHEHLAAVAGGTIPFVVHLRGTGTFRPISPVVFVNVVEGISSCEQLASKVRQGPLAIDPQFPYHPHVTVAHHLAEPELDKAFEELGDFSCRFTVTHVRLYEHLEDEGWTPARDFALDPGT